ncbi:MULTISPECIES: hypothetical protein [Streptomyces]|uniref:Uncharacterized protein n=1 Tax=Streptomyces albidoflavus TaxID=1886 RepID=A0A126Y356_9ACTN|nr:hypothetical protein [Streptomyces albidoflavus]SCE47333.1 hypothetical protein GA0115236_161824 [Streptomyces sp. IgraMP-1]BDH51516.1 hypothetical protein MTP02_25270 [Streptomyces albus]AGI88834.1 Hypothetical protein XNR_2462 [Streptomyces albidoflavus]AMM09216.1 hypothetical protein Salbus254_2711 [Streptomyces albidoflavus]QLP92605.1 Hypothetical protein XNRR2_2462 [Streptomyces albidoflavus]
MPDSARTPLPLTDSSAAGRLVCWILGAALAATAADLLAPMPTWWPLVWSGLWALLPVTLAFWVPVRAREKRRLREDPAAA